MNNGVIVTTSWDDGQKIDIKVANLLDKYGLKGTFYVTKNYRDPLEKEQILELDKCHEIGAHTLNHVDLLNVPLLEAKKEIIGSKSYIESIIGHYPDMFCYPWGRYNDRIKKILTDAGFIAARTCKHGGFNKPNDVNEWQITLHASNGSPRITIGLCVTNHLSINSLVDWEIRAKELFNLALRNGGVYHLWGHGDEFEKKNEWQKLERVLEHISNVDGVRYMTNGMIFREVDSW